MSNTYSLIDYFDVWGNEEDGFYVNNQWVVHENIQIDDDADHRDIRDLLHKMGFLATNDASKIAVEEKGELIEIYARENMFPLMGLVPNY